MVYEGASMMRDTCEKMEGHATMKHGLKQADAADAPIRRAQP